jgi:hypothetical protein
MFVAWMDGKRAAQARGQTVGHCTDKTEEGEENKRDPYDMNGLVCRVMVVGTILGGEGVLDVSQWLWRSESVSAASHKPHTKTRWFSRSSDMINDFDWISDLNNKGSK